nr:lipase family protein [Pontibacter silvestris]
MNLSCQTDAVSPIVQPEVVEGNEHFVSSELLTTVPQNILESYASSKGYASYASQVKYDVSVYKMIYNTTYQGKQIKASGLVCVPVGMNAPASVISAQHGTIFRDSDAPTGFAELSGFEAFAAAGYVTLIPDYIGFGESKDIFHPYYDWKHAALTVVDMIKAGKYFYQKEAIPVNNKLFLVGYSEGGFVTLAAQKEIEKNPGHGLKVTASAAGAGGYDLVSMLGNVKAGQAYPYPAYLAYVLQSYLYTNSWQRPLTDFFQEPYASKLPQLFDGTKGGSAINRELITDPAALFAPDFFKALQDDSQEQALKQALYENSLATDWAPQSPTRLYHGTADVIVPFENSQRTYNTFVAQGAKQLEFFPIEGKSHSTAFVPMLDSVVPWVQLFEKVD